MSHLWNGDKVSLRVGVDLDNVVYNFTKKACEAVLREGFVISSEPDCWDWFLPSGLTRERFLEIISDSVDDLQFFWKGDMLDNAADHISRLREAGHEIHIVTYRDYGKIYTAEQATRYWLNTKGVEFDSLTFSQDKTVVSVDVFIEDNLDNYDALEAAGTKAYLVNRTYNQVEDDGRRRVDSFGDFADLILNQTTVQATSHE